MLCWMNWWNGYSVLLLDGDVYGCPSDWMSEKGNAMRWRNNRDLQLLSLICSFQERVVCFVELDLLYCLCCYDSHGIRGNWLRVFFRHFFITVRDYCPWAVDTACRLACYAHCCRFIQLSWVHALFVLLYPCDMPCVIRECNAVHSWMPEEGCILLWLLWYPCYGPLLCMAVVSVFQRCRDCASLHLQLNALLCYVMYSWSASCFWSDSVCAMWAMCFHLSSLHLLSGRGYGWSTLHGEVKRVLWWCGRLAELGSVL